MKRSSIKQLETYVPRDAGLRGPIGLGRTKPVRQFQTGAVVACIPEIKWNGLRGNVSGVSVGDN